MSINLSLRDIIEKELDDRSKRSKASSQKITYNVLLDDTRDEDNVAQISFKLSKPIPEKDMQDRGKGVLRYVAESLQHRDLGVVENILSQYGLAKKVGKKRSRGTVQVHLGDFEEGGRAVGIQSTKGKLLSQVNLKSLLEVLGKNYLIQDMKRPNAPLKYRTGRFANSMKVTAANIQDSDRGRKPTLDIFYTYKQNPYATFDPRKSSRPAMYMRPTFGARNPQVHIGDALAKAARDLIHSRYNINVKEKQL